LIVHQLPLSLNWSDQATFSNFQIANNRLVVAQLQQFLNTDAATATNRPVCFCLQGEHGTGLSHLLYAACHYIHQQGKSAVYLPLQPDAAKLALLEGVEQLTLVCWDNVETVAGDARWEEALFHSYNRIQASKGRLLIASHTPIAQAGWRLPDLASRLLAGNVFTVVPLGDEEKLKALQKRAQLRGLHLSSEVGGYLLQHVSRDMPALLAYLDRLDTASLASQRRLTIPFIKQVLEL